MERFFAVLVVVSVLLTGCQQSSFQRTGTHNLESSSGMVSYLNSRQLPALESVEEWKNEYSPGLKLDTRHYEIFTTLLDPLMLEQVPGFMESANLAYQEQMLLADIPSTSKLVVYLFDNRQQWERFTKSFAGEQAEVFCKIKAGAYYLNGACVAYNIGRERTFSILGHEGWHQFNSRHFKYRLPSWLDEGIAMQFETNRYKDGLFYFEPAKNLGRLGGLKLVISKKSMLPLQELISLNPGQVVGSDDSTSVIAFYSQAYAMIRFFREENFGRNLQPLHQLLMDGLYGRWPLNAEAKRIAMDRNIPLTVRWNQLVGKELFEYYISDDFQQTEEEYLAFCRKIVYHVQIKQ